MKAIRAFPHLERLRSRPVWKLLAADNAPEVLAMLQAHLYVKERTLSASILHERIQSDLEELRSNGTTMRGVAKFYIASWLADGYLERRLPSGAAEEEYELSTGAIDAIRFVTGMEREQTAATESRLTLVMHALADLAADTDEDKRRRVQRLQAQQDKLQAEIDAIENGTLTVLPQETALERMREILMLADDLTGDFRRVREQFEHLNRDLREKIMNSDGGRGNVLGDMFDGIDKITDSQPGRTFAAFWSLLSNPVQQAALDQSIEDILGRQFIDAIDPKDRRALIGLTGGLLTQSGSVREVSQKFSRGLKNFVQSREYLEQRRINRLLQDAQRSAMELKDKVKPYEAINFTLSLATATFRSASQLVPFDPSMQYEAKAMQTGEAGELTPDTFKDMMGKSEIDFRALKENVRSVLEQRSQASVADVLSIHPAKQGLGSVVGLIELASRFGVVTKEKERVTWTHGNALRSATIQTIYFVKGQFDERQRSRL